MKEMEVENFTIDDYSCDTCGSQVFFTIERKKDKLYIDKECPTCGSIPESLVLTFQELEKMKKIENMNDSEQLITPIIKVKKHDDKIYIAKRCECCGYFAGVLEISKKDLQKIIEIIQTLNNDIRFVMSATIRLIK